MSASYVLLTEIVRSRSARADLNPIDEGVEHAAAHPDRSRGPAAGRRREADRGTRQGDRRPRRRRSLRARVIDVDAALQADLAEKAAKSGWSAHDTEQQVKWAKQNADQTRQRRAAAEKHVKAAVEQLEKVTDRKSATIAMADYYSGGETSKLMNADGWKVVEDGYSIETVASADECGCKGVAAGLQSEVETPFGKRILLCLLASDGDLDDNLFDAYMNGAKDDVEDTVSEENDDVWNVIERIPDGDLNKILALAAAELLDDSWRIGEGLRAAIAAKWPAPTKSTQRSSTTTSASDSRSKR